MSCEVLSQLHTHTLRDVHVWKTQLADVLHLDPEATAMHFFTFRFFLKSKGQPLIQILNNTVLRSP